MPASSVPNGIVNSESTTAAKLAEPRPMPSVRRKPISQGEKERYAARKLAADPAIQRVVRSSDGAFQPRCHTDDPEQQAEVPIAEGDEGNRIPPHGWRLLDRLDRALLAEVRRP